MVEAFPLSSAAAWRAARGCRRRAAGGAARRGLPAAPRRGEAAAAPEASPSDFACCRPAERENALSVTRKLSRNFTLIRPWKRMMGRKYFPLGVT